MQVLLAKHSKEWSWPTGGVLQIPYLKPSVFQWTNLKFFFSRSNLILRLTSEKGTFPLMIRPMAK